MHTFQPTESYARQLDAADPLSQFRECFLIPHHSDGRKVVYLCGHSLGLQPRAVRSYLEQELEDWAQLAVDAHFKGRTPWYSYHEIFREPIGRLVGAQLDEVVVMNGLTVNLHLMLISFYCPVGERRLILMEEPTFPSDRYAVQSQLRLHGLDPSEALLTIKARPGEQLIRSEDIGALLEARGQEIAVILLSGVNFFTGQLFDIERITAAAHRQGCIVGWDLAHAVGNVPLRLHDWQVDFAVWCSYKYLNAGPGAVAGCFIHARHVQRLDLPRLAGWWGHDPATRFRMQLEPTWNPSPSADSWQLSNPPILALAPLRASLDLFDEATMPALRERSEHLTSYLEFLLDGIPGSRYEIMSPREPAQRGCQLSVLVRDKPREVLTALVKAGIVCDFREPNIIRVAPVPLYNSFEDVWRFAQALTGV